MKAMVIECCFIDNESDMELYDAETFAEEIVRGIVGKKSKKGWIEELQKECVMGKKDNLRRDIADENTLNACPMLRIGDTGEITKIMQQHLATLGYTLLYGADGIFGYGTRQVVVKFQRDSNLVGDGIVGIGTWKKLLSL